MKVVKIKIWIVDLRGEESHGNGNNHYGWAIWD